ncbi:MAG: OmpA family protein [Gammaproteobacteria bacterium]|nr:OmpA family protein [Gammaproteobacteria bacterium]
MNQCVSMPIPEFHKQDGVGTAIVYFSTNNSILCGLNLEIIEKLKKELGDAKDKIVMICGYASGDGKAAYNMNLSQRRIDEVLKKLSLDISNDNIFTLPFGESESAKTETAKNWERLEYQRSFSRKVTILFLPKQLAIISKPVTKKKKPPVLFPPNMGTGTPSNPAFDYKTRVPEAPSLLDGVSKTLEIDRLKKMIKPCLGNFCLDIPGSVGSSATIFKRLNGGELPSNIMSDIQKSFTEEAEEHRRVIEDLQNPNRVY